MIIFLITSLSYAGAETQLLHLATNLKRRGWDVRIVSMTAPQAYVSELYTAGIHLYSLNMKRGIPDPRGLFKLIRILRQSQPKVLHSHMFHANILARVARLFTFIPVLISTIHNIHEGRCWRGLAYRFTDHLCDLTTHVCQAGVDKYVKAKYVPIEKLIYLPNGIELDKFKMSPGTLLLSNLKYKSENFKWLAIGRFTKAKDYPNLLHAFKIVNGSMHQRAELIIVGDGPLRNEMEALAKNLGLNNVDFVGTRNDIPELMKYVDSFVLSSSWEGLPMVLLEAAASGLPIVATNVGGNAEVVVDNMNGRLVPSGDSESLATAMLEVMSHSKEELAALGNFGLQHASMFDIKEIVNKWEMLYISFINQKISKLPASQ